MKIKKIIQQPVSFLEFNGQVSYDATTGEIIIHANKFKIFGHEVEWTEDEKFVPQEDDRVYITDQGLILVRDEVDVDFSQFKRYDLFGWVEKDYQTGELVFKYIVHPPVSKEENK